MRTMHLFAGAGGGLLADLILGHTPVCAVEWDAYACAVLRERRDEGWFPGLHVHEGDIRRFDASEWKGRVDCIHAGFPCQPFARPGLGKGENDERNMWPEVVRVIRETKPRWIMLENSPVIVEFEYFGQVLADISDMGFCGSWAVIPASCAGAPHNRSRWWLVANSYGEHNSIQIQHEKQGGAKARAWEPSGTVGEIIQAASASGVLRMDDGMAEKLDRYKCAGNGQVPLCAALAWKLLGGE